MNELARNLQAILFHFGEPKSVAVLAKSVGRSEGEVRDALGALESGIAETGLRLMRNNDEVALVTAPETGAVIERITREELEKELGKAALETLAIVLYHGPITRSGVDNIRGVNSTFIIRNLLVRGLVEKVPNPEDQRSFLYKPTMDLLRYLGVATIEGLPDFAQVKTELEAFLAHAADIAPQKEETPVIHAEDGKDEQSA